MFIRRLRPLGLYNKRVPHGEFSLARFYRAMHYSAKRGIEVACRMSVCLSVTLPDQEHLGWKSIISGTLKAMNFKFGRKIRRLNPSKSPLKFWRQGGVGVSPGTAQFFGYPLLSQEQVKLRTSNFARTLIG